MQDLWQFALLGLVSGGAYSLIGVGILAVYKGSRVVNLAQGALGMAGSYIFWELYRGGTGLAVWLSVAIALLISAVIGSLLYLAIMRVVRNAAEIVRMITTLGILVTLEAVATLRYGSDVTNVQPIFGTGSVTIAGATLTSGAIVVLVALAIIAIGIAFVFGRTSLGGKATALQDNPNAASAVGISPHPVGAITWAMGAVCATIAGIVLLPLTGLAPTQLDSSLVPALAAVLVARFRSVTVTVLTGLAFGVLESIGIDKGLDSGLTSSLPFIVIVAVLFLRGRRLPSRDEVKYRLPALGSGRIPVIVTLIVFCGSLLLVIAVGGAWQQAVITSSLFAIIALSVVVVTGYAGQLSLAPLALAGLSALVAAQLASAWHWSFIAAVAGGTVVSGVVGLIVGAPAVRVRGANLAIVTLGLAMAIQIVFLTAPRFTGGTYGLYVPDPTLFGLPIDSGNFPIRYAVVCLAAAGVTALVVANIRASASGRRYAAIRSSERGAAAAGVSVSGGKLAAFATSGLLAGLAGGLMTFRFTAVGFEHFQLFNAIQLVGLTIVGGAALISGAVFASLIAVGGIMSMFVLNTLGLTGYDQYIAILTGLFIIQVMLMYPDGIMFYNIESSKKLRQKLRARTRSDNGPGSAVPVMDDRAPVPTELSSATNAGIHGESLRQAARDEVALGVEGISVRFDAVKALDDITFEVVAGRVLGVIGPNGAGKTTLIDVITGFRRPDEGRISYHDRLLPTAHPHRTAQKGIARTFQNLELFDDLTVRENLLVATEKFGIISYLVNAVFRRTPPLTDATTNVLHHFGLTDSLNAPANELPQGKRRLLAVARALAQHPAVLCLDEPAAGVSAAERPALGQMIRSFATDLGIAVVLVEHDVDLVSSVCDDVLALDFGREIARGAPADVLASDAVRSAYLGSASPPAQHPPGASAVAAQEA